MPQDFTNHQLFDSSSSNDTRKLYSKFDGPTMINFGRTNRNSNDGGIEFRAHHNHRYEEEESGVSSPPLWHSSPPRSPASETTPLQSQAYNHHHYRMLSPTSRTQAIARGKEEMMEMVKSMPESSYELSLKDLVDHHSMLVHGGAEPTTGTTTTITTAKQVEERELDKKKKKSDKGGRISRNGNGSMKKGNTNGGPFLLKMFVPVSLGLKKKSSSSSSTATCAKVSPKPEFADKDWWKKRLSGSGETQSSGSGSSGSSDSNRSRNNGDCFPGCWDFLTNKKSKSKENKRSMF